MLNTIENKLLEVKKLSEKATSDKIKVRERLAIQKEIDLIMKQIKSLYKESDRLL